MYSSMSEPYQRVLPRDAFNESKLLKCIGKLCLEIEERNAIGWSYIFEDKAFQIEQDSDDGSIAVVNIHFFKDGKEKFLSTGLNSRLSWPLRDEEGEYIFHQDGKLIV